MIVGDRGAVPDREGFEAGRVKPAAGENEEGFLGLVGEVALGQHGRHHGVDVFFEVEAGLLLELVLVFLRRFHLLEPFAEL